MGTTIQRWLPQLDLRVWILAGGRLLSQLGIGFVLFYAPIFFVNEVGLSATQVGLGLGSEALSGLLGRFLGGSLSDSPRWGRRKTLLLSALISAAADGVLLLTQDFPTFVAGNLLMGLGVGLYWPSTEAVVADITQPRDRNEAFAVVRAADNVGLGLGVILGGILIATTAAYRWLFAIDGFTFLLFFGVIYWAITETRPDGDKTDQFWRGWGRALGDHSLLVYALINVGFTGYISQMQSTLPVYLNRFVPSSAETVGLSAGILSALFAGHVALTVLFQLPLVKLLKPLSLSRSLMVSACLWGMTFTLIWGAGSGIGTGVVLAGLALTTAALATASYTPVASTLVVTLAPEHLRGVYLSVNSMCWAVGYFIGPPMGGWALDQTRAIADGFWLLAATSVLGVIAVLVYLEQRLQKRGL